MTLNNAELIRSLCPDFRWLNYTNKRLIQGIYKEELYKTKQRIIELNQLKIEANQKVTNWNDRWLLELIHEECDQTIQAYKTQAKRYGWITSPSRKQKPGAITDADISRAKAVPIGEFYPGRLRGVAGRLLGLCPFHEERRPSFTIYEQQNSWWCYAEGIGGSVVDYVMKMKNIGFIETIKFLTNK